MRLYLDSVFIIYLVERVPPYDAAVTARVTVPGVDVVASELGRMECLIKPLQNKDAATVQNFQTFFASNVKQLVTLNRAVFERAAAIRAQYSAIKTPDAIHLAAAVDSACDIFLTNDHQLRAFTGITGEVI
jgi:uncharacterized protein